MIYTYQKPQSSNLFLSLPHQAPLLQLDHSSDVDPIPSHCLQFKGTYWYLHVLACFMFLLYHKNSWPQDSYRFNRTDPVKMQAISYEKCKTIDGIACMKLLIWQLLKLQLKKVSELTNCWFAVAIWSIWVSGLNACV